MAVSLVESLTTGWDPKNYRDTYTERVEQLLDAKRKNREIVVPEDAAQTEGKVVDLLSALQASVDAAKSHRAGNTRDVPKLKTRKPDESDSGRTRTTSTRKGSGTKSSGKKSTSKKTAGKRSGASGRRQAS